MIKILSIYYMCVVLLHINSILLYEQAVYIFGNYYSCLIVENFVNSLKLVEGSSRYFSRAMDVFMYAIDASRDVYLLHSMIL